jgi:hypothetical protein
VLRLHLTPEEFDQLKRFGVLNIRSMLLHDRVYQVRAQSGRVIVRDSGIHIMELCIRTEINLPADEHVLVHKLMIQAAEAEYLARANVLWQRGQATVAGRMSSFD